MFAIGYVIGILVIPDQVTIQIADQFRFIVQTFVVERIVPVHESIDAFGDILDADAIYEEIVPRVVKIHVMTFEGDHTRITTSGFAREMKGLMEILEKMQQHEKGECITRT